AHNGDYTTTGWIDRATGISSVAFTNFQESDRDRDELQASTSYFWKGAGTHQLKVGTDLDLKNTFKNVNFTTGTPIDPTMCSPLYAGGSTSNPNAPAVTFQPGNLPCGAIYRPVNGLNVSGANTAQYTVQTQIPELDFKSKSRTFYAQD